jgi:hypothetical protein
MYSGPIKDEDGNITGFVDSVDPELRFICTGIIDEAINGDMNSYECFNIIHGMILKYQKEDEEAEKAYRNTGKRDFIV